MCKGGGGGGGVAGLVRRNQGPVAAVSVFVAAHTQLSPVSTISNCSLHPTVRSLAFSLLIRVVADSLPARAITNTNTNVFRCPTCLLLSRPIELLPLVMVSTHRLVPLPCDLPLKGLAPLGIQLTVCYFPLREPFVERRCEQKVRLDRNDKSRHQAVGFNSRPPRECVRPQGDA